MNCTFRPCIHRMFPCGVGPCASVTRSDDGGCKSTISQHTTIPLLICLVSFSDFIKALCLSNRLVNWWLDRSVFCEVVLLRPPSSDLVTDSQEHTPQGNILWIQGLRPTQFEWDSMTIQKACGLQKVVRRWRIFIFPEFFYMIMPELDLLYSICNHTMLVFTWLAMHFVKEEQLWQWM